MKFDSNASNMQIWFDKGVFIWWKVCSRTNFIKQPQTRFFSSFLNFSKLWFISNASNISSNTRVWWWLMKCLMHLRRPLSDTVFFLVQTWYFYHKKVVTWKLQHFDGKEDMVLSFLHRWDHCWKCEFDINVKIGNYNHHDGKQLLFH